MNRSTILPVACIAALAAFTTLHGCEEDNTSTSRQVEVDGDDVTTTNTTVRENPDGSIDTEKRTTERDLESGKTEIEIERQSTPPVDRD